MYLPILNEWALMSNQKIGISTPGSKVTVQTVQQHSFLDVLNAPFLVSLSLYQN